PTDNTCFCIGPEGGFSTEELELLQKNNGGATFVSLGTTRLRAETAAIAASVLLHIR
ncbi:MAG TPA: RsmE family RNA methyltransferase, partial [Candidatus Kapabacteria bacterium]|nr:RsmE family RNA methyltransferase [Candidatus Kapabacteria bacterium]